MNDNLNGINRRRSSRLKCRSNTKKKSCSSSTATPKRSKSSKPSKTKSIPKPPKPRSRRKSIGRKKRRNSETYGAGNGVDRPYFNEVRQKNYEDKKTQTREDWPFLKKIRDLRTENKMLRIQQEEDKQIKLAQQAIINHQEMTMDDLILMLCKTHKMLNMTKDQLHKIKNQMVNKYKDIENDDYVYVEVGDYDPNDKAVDDDGNHPLFGRQGDALKKYLRFHIKIIIMCLDMLSMAKAQHIPVLIVVVLKGMDRMKPGDRTPSPNTIRYWRDNYMEYLNDLCLIKMLKNRNYKKLHGSTEQHGDKFNVLLLSYKDFDVQRNEQCLISEAEPNIVEESKNNKKYLKYGGKIIEIDAVSESIKKYEIKCYECKD